MKKTCFVIMGYGVKNNINLDATYSEIIKPCIQKKGLIPYPLFEQDEYNAYRCDEIVGSASIDYKFVTCLSKADIVIADISTMNINAIYELGARHALKPRSTILLCAKDDEHRFNFFDITYVPIIFYSHGGLHIDVQSVKETQVALNKQLDFAIYSNTSIPDNPIQRALHEQKQYQHFPTPAEKSIYHLYQTGMQFLRQKKYTEAYKILSNLYEQDSTEENLLLAVLARYKQAESAKKCEELIECINQITTNIDVDASTSETLFGRMAAINLRLYNLTQEPNYYYSALDYYRRGANYSKKDLYCPRNYCALLLRIFEITDDPNVLREHYYTAKHYAKQFRSTIVSVYEKGTYEEHIYYQCNMHDLRAIIEGQYENYDVLARKIKNDKNLNNLQRTTILTGMKQLKKDIEEMDKRVNIF